MGLRFPPLKYRIIFRLYTSVLLNLGIRQSPSNGMKLPAFGAHPSHLFRTLYRSDPGVIAVGSSGAVGCGAHKSLDMVTVAIKIHMNDSSHHLKVKWGVIFFL